MAAQIRFHPSISQFTAGTLAAELEAGTVRDALVQVTVIVPSLGARLFSCEGELRSVFRITRNSVPASEDDQVRDGDVLELSLA